MGQIKRKKIIVLLLFFVMIISIFIIQKVIDKNKEINNVKSFISYKSTNGGYSISLPQNWEVREITEPLTSQKNIVSIIYPEKPKAYFDVYRLSEIMTIEDLAKWEADSNLELEQYNEIKNSERKIGINSGYLKEFTYYRHYVLGDYIDHCYDWMILHENKGYIFTSCLDDKDWKDNEQIFIKILESIVIN